jgi:competence protein ComEA
MSDAIAADTKSKSAEKKETKTKDKKASTTKSGTTKPVNINKADKEELATLDGIGEERAKDIIAYRKKKGPFKKPEDLMN